MLPALDARNIKLFYTTIGTAEKGVDFAAQTGFPAGLLLADERNACYEALSFRRGLRATFFDAATPAAIRKRQREGRDQDLKDVLKVGRELQRLSPTNHRAAVVAGKGRRWAVHAACAGPSASRAPDRPRRAGCCAVCNMKPSTPTCPLPLQTYKPLMPPKMEQAFWQVWGPSEAHSGL